MGAFLKALT